MVSPDGESAGRGRGVFLPSSSDAKGDGAETGGSGEIRSAPETEDSVKDGRRKLLNLSRLISIRRSITRKGTGKGNLGKLNMTRLKREPSLMYIQLRKTTNPFSLIVFFKMFVYHTLYPLSIPLVWAIDGKPLLYNLCMLPRERKEARANGVFGFQVIVAIIVFAASIMRAVNSDAASSAFAFLAVVLYCNHKAMIALKYAVMSDVVWDLITSRVIPRRVIREFELVNWINPSAENIDAHINWAAKRLHIDIDKYYFLTNERSAKRFWAHDTQPMSRRNSIMAVNKFYDENPTGADAKGEKGAPGPGEGVDDDGMVRIPLRQVAARAVDYVKYRTAKQPFEGRLWLLGGLQALLPVIAYYTAGDGRDRGKGSLAIAELVLWTFTTILHNVLFLLFTVVGTTDYRRRMQTSKLLCDVINPSAARDSGDYFDDVAVDLAWPKNVESWVVMRRILHEFGALYRLRIVAYLSFNLVVLVCSILYLLVAIFVLTEELPIEYLVSAGVFCICCGFIVGDMIISGSAANEQAELQLAALMRAQLDLRALRSDIASRSSRDKEGLGSLGKALDERISRSDYLLDTTLHIIEHETEFRPIRVLGVRASYSLFTTFATVVVGTVVSVLTDF